MFYPMEEQASHITKLLEENRRYIKEHGKLKKNPSTSSSSSSGSVRGSSQFLSSDNYTMDTYGGQYSSNSTPDYSTSPADLQDRVMSLQVQNSELNVCLERERRRRREAEEKVERDESYIKRLEDCIQTLKGTRVVMDPSTYRQLAEAYMASQRIPARRPHSHTPTHHPSDLVCDNTNPHQRLSHPVFPVTSSCPSSPKSSSSSSSSSSGDSQPFRSTGRSKKERKELGGGGGGGGSMRGLGAGAMNAWDYQQLLESLENLDGGSRGALS